MARWGWVGGMRRMNLPAADPQLGLSAVELRPTVQKLRTQHLLIPLSGPLPIADLDIDVLYHRNPGHGCTSCCLSFIPLIRFPGQDAIDTSIASGLKTVSSRMVAPGQPMMTPTPGGGVHLGRDEEMGRFSVGRMQAGHLAGGGTQHSLIHRVAERRGAGPDAWDQMPRPRT